MYLFAKFLLFFIILLCFYSNNSQNMLEYKHEKDV